MGSGGVMAYRQAEGFAFMVGHIWPLGVTE